MPTFHVLIFANPVEGQDEAFADWYENTHLDMSGPIDGSQVAMWVYTPAGARHEA